VRARLEECGHQRRLPSGAKVFVYPELSDQVTTAIARLQLRPCHIVVAESFEPLVREAVARLAARQDVRVRRSQHLGYYGEEGELLLQKWTFLDIPRSRLASQSVVQSTTEAHGAMNPRRELLHEVD